MGAASKRVGKAKMNCSLASKSRQQKRNQSLSSLEYGAQNPNHQRCGHPDCSRPKPKAKGDPCLWIPWYCLHCLTCLRQTEWRTEKVLVPKTIQVPEIVYETKMVAIQANKMCHLHLVNGSELSFLTLAGAACNY